MVVIFGAFFPFPPQKKKKKHFIEAECFLDFEVEHGTPVYVSIALY